MHLKKTREINKNCFSFLAVNNAVNRSESKKDNFQIKMELDPLSIMHGARYKCHFCGLQFLAQDMFESHIQTAHIKLPPQPDSPPPKDSRQRMSSGEESSSSSTSGSGSGKKNLRRENSFNEKSMIKKARIEEENEDDDDGIVMLSSGDESSCSGTSGSVTSGSGKEKITKTSNNWESVKKIYYHKCDYCDKKFTKKYLRHHHCKIYHTRYYQTSKSSWYEKLGSPPTFSINPDEWLKFQKKKWAWQKENKHLFGTSLVQRVKENKHLFGKKPMHHSPVLSRVSQFFLILIFRPDLHNISFSRPM